MSRRRRTSVTSTSEVVAPAVVVVPRLEGEDRVVAIAAIRQCASDLRLKVALRHSSQSLAALAFPALVRKAGPLWQTKSVMKENLEVAVLLERAAAELESS